MKDILDTSYLIPIKDTAIDMTVVAKLRLYPDMLQVLYDWIILPDYNNLSLLVKYLPILNQIQKPPVIMTLWRGIDPTSGYQDKMGLNKTGILWFGKLNHAVGDKLKIEITKPLSFSYRRNVVDHFGSTIIECDYKSVKDQCLIFTDELYYAIAEKQRIEATSLSEVIILPKRGKVVDFKVVAV